MSAPSDTKEVTRLRETLGQVDLVALLDDLESARDYLSRGPWEASEPANEKFTVKIASYQYECPEGSAQIRAERSSIPTRCLIPFGIIHRDDAEGIVLMRNRLEDAIQVVQAARAALQPKAEPEVKDEAG